LFFFCFSISFVGLSHPFVRITEFLSPLFQFSILSTHEQHKGKRKNECVSALPEWKRKILKIKPGERKRRNKTTGQSFSAFDEE
jgi:hypothetical protein